MDEYKIKQLELMLSHEEGEEGGFGAHLTHWWGDAAPINLDAGALKVLIWYYGGVASEGN